MPFVNQDHRSKPDFTIPGDICYVEYKKLIDSWRKEPRWTTAHNLTKKWFDLATDEETAHFLAWMVWFNKEVMVYENQKENENGQI